jgi:hypothetical protein
MLATQCATLLCPSNKIWRTKAFFLDLAHPIHVINRIMQPAAAHHVVGAPTHFVALHLQRVFTMSIDSMNCLVSFTAARSMTAVPTILSGYALASRVSLFPRIFCGVACGVYLHTLSWAKNMQVQAVWINVENFTKIVQTSFSKINL